MSRRFGRNQKRHMREQIAQAEQRTASMTQAAAQCQVALANQSALLRETSDQLRAHKEFFAEFTSMVGKYAIMAGIEPRFMKNIPTAPQWRMPAHQPSPIFSAPSNASMMSKTKIHAEVMELMDVDVVRNQFTDKLHVRGTLADGRVGYAISRAALYSMTVDELVRQIAPELARALAQSIKQGGR